MSGRRFRVTAAARRDLKGIANYTADQWGESQRDLYLSNLERVMMLLAENPDLGVLRSEILPGLRSFPCDHHVIFYRVGKGTVTILRVLHERMNVTVKSGLPDG